MIHQEEARTYIPGNYVSIFSDIKGWVLVSFITLVSAITFKFVYANLGQSPITLPTPSEDPQSGYFDSACFYWDLYSVSALNLLRSLDPAYGTPLFLALLLGLFSLVFFLYGHLTGKSKERVAARRRQHSSSHACECGGAASVRKSVRVKLRNHELVFVERVGGKEFERQKTEYTERQVNELQASNEYLEMIR